MSNNDKDGALVPAFDTRSFATRTERRIKDNPHVDGVHIIGLDLGYSGPKVVHEKGNLCFPKFCMKITGEQMGTPGKNDIVYEAYDSGSKFYVGDMAIRSLKEGAVVTESALLGRNHYFHPDYIMTMRAAIALSLWDLPKTDGHDLFIQTGLPPAYMTDSQYLRSVLEKRHHYKITLGGECREFDYTIHANQVDIMYQPMGTYYSVVFDRDGNMTPDAFEYMNSNLMVFDGGFGTLDRFLVRGKQLEAKESDASLGMSRVLDETKKMLLNELGVDVSIPALQTALKSGIVKKDDIITLQRKEYSIAPYLKKANELVREEAFESIKSDVLDIQKLIMSGGTGAAWCDYFTDRLKGLSGLSVIPGTKNSNLPAVYTNARGYYYYRLNKIRKSAK